MITVKGRRFTIQNSSDFDDTLNSYESMATNVYYATDSIKLDTTNTLAEDQESVGKIPDKKGHYPQIYRGDANNSVIGVSVPSETPLTGVPPLLTRNSGDPRAYLSFVNIPNIYFDTGNFSTPDRYTWPHAMTFLIRSQQGQEFEAWIGAGECRNYIGDNGGIIRIGGATEYFVNSPSPAYMKMTSLHCEFDNDWVNLWIDGVYSDRIANTVNDDGDHALLKTVNQIGTSTNSAPFDFFAQYIWSSNEYANLQANRDAILSSINTKWLVGSYPNKPYASNLNIEKNSGVLSVTFDANNATSEQIAATEYRWFLCLIDPDSGGSFKDQILVSTEATVTEASFASHLDELRFVSCYVNIGGFYWVKSWSLDYLG